MKKYGNNVSMFKALSDNNRLQIIELLSNGELCACKILEKFNITQPTLSHHMKILTDVNLVNSYKKSNWMMYSLNKEKFKEIKDFLDFVINS